MTTYLLLLYFIPLISTVLLARYINDYKEDLGPTLIISAIPAFNIIVVIGLLIIIFYIKYGETITNIYTAINKWFKHEKN